jgi:Uma2 family endonuclease
MATTTLISVEEYLKTSAHPDCEYVRGVLKDRAVPEYNHAVWQKILLRWFGDHEREWGIEALPELRVQVAADNYRVPDVTLLSSNAPREQVITYPPLAVFEILSPSDAMTDVMEKLADYQDMGIAAIWLINPKKHPKKPVCHVYSSGHLTPAAAFELPGTNFQVLISEIAALID